MLNLKPFYFFVITLFFLCTGCIEINNYLGPRWQPRQIKNQIFAWNKESLHEKTNRSLLISVADSTTHSIANCILTGQSNTTFEFSCTVQSLDEKNILQIDFDILKTSFDSVRISGLSTNIYNISYTETGLSEKDSAVTAMILDPHLLTFDQGALKQYSAKMLLSDNKEYVVVAQTDPFPFIDIFPIAAQMTYFMKHKKEFINLCGALINQMKNLPTRKYHIKVVKRPLKFGPFVISKDFFTDCVVTDM
jgi:hypothetical protein